MNQFEAIRRSGQVGEVRIGGGETPWSDIPSLVRG
jgi:hypothetical protein